MNIAVMIGILVLFSIYLIDQVLKFSEKDFESLFIGNISSIVWHIASSSHSYTMELFFSNLL